MQIITGVECLCRSLSLGETQTDLGLLGLCTEYGEEKKVNREDSWRCRSVALTWWKDEPWIK